MDVKVVHLDYPITPGCRATKFEFDGSSGSSIGLLTFTITYHSDWPSETSFARSRLDCAKAMLIDPTPGVTIPKQAIISIVNQVGDAIRKGDVSAA